MPVLKTFCVLISLLFLTPVAQAAPVPAGDPLVREIRQLVEDYHVDKNYLPDLSTQTTVTGLLAALEDPYTKYLPPAEFARLLESLNPEYAGIGVVIFQSGETIIIDHVFPATPAANAGLKSGDQVLAVDTVSVQGLTLDEVASKIRGPADSILTLTITPAGGTAPRSLSLTRREIILPQVEGKLLAPELGYIRIYGFGDRAGTEFAATYQELRQAGMTKLVLDLRGNTGGMVTAAEDIGDTLLPTGPLYHLVDAEAEKTALTSGDEQPLPMAILVNHDTASAAELLAGALRDNAHAILIGTPTYGKGSVQSLIPLQAGGVLKLTTARYFTPGWQPVDQVGLQPEEPVTYPSLQLIRAKAALDPTAIRELHFSLNEPVTWVNGEKILLADRPILREDRAYLPIRFLAEALGLTVTYQETAQQAVISGNNRQLTLSLAQTGGETTRLPLINDRLYAPVRQIAEQLGLDLSFQENARTVTLNVPRR
ncbi:MAG: S41 family peptidase [Heliobacteriaceae bacterium]|nr:S41 family peptidase [Heliobacteriaceae bacterium]